MLDVPTEFLTNVARTCNVGDQKEKTAYQTFTDGSGSEPDRQPFKSDEEPIEGEMGSSIFIVDTEKPKYFGSVCHNTTTTMRETERGEKRKTSLSVSYSVVPFKGSERCPTNRIDMTLLSWCFYT